MSAKKDLQMTKSEPYKSCIEFVTQLFNNLEGQVKQNHIPYAIRAMLRIVAIFA